jgi:tRNA threonylcarbamoyladenosine biosynthesis protein TsaB
MSLILNIDTATDTACVSLASKGILLGFEINDNQKDHAAFLQPAIYRIFNNNQLQMSALDAVAVVTGPGSYTGLRVGMASAKGLCYALDIPLIGTGSLELLAASAIGQGALAGMAPATLVCPMIDARRMEVFTAVYDAGMAVVTAPHARILDENAFEAEMGQKPVLFLGNGSQKWKKISSHTNALFSDIKIIPQSFPLLSYQLYVMQSFISLAYSEPAYLKEFYSNQKGQAQ